VNQEKLKELIHYNPDTGLFTWLKRDRKWFVNNQAFARWNTIYPGIEAGYIRKSKSGKSYIVISILAIDYKAHRLAFLYISGDWPNVIDHNDGNGVNNKWLNLNDVSHAENTRNQKLHITNSSGVSGVTYRKDREKWRVRISIDNKMTPLGSFDDFFEAVCTRKSAEVTHNYHPNHGEVRPL